MRGALCNSVVRTDSLFGVHLGLGIGLFGVSFGGHIGGVVERSEAGGPPCKAAIQFTNRNTRIRIPETQYTTNMSGVGMACPPRRGACICIYPPRQFS